MRIQKTVVYLYSDNNNKKIEIMTPSTFYIWNTKTGENFDTNENRFYGSNWDVELEEKSYLETFTANHTEKFENCIIVDQNAE